MEFHSIAGQPPLIPDALTLPQWILDNHQENRPQYPPGAPWVIADKSGKTMGLDKLKTRTNGLAVSLRDKFLISKNEVVFFLSSNHTDYLVCMWAVHRLLGIVAPCNPSLTVPELVQYLKHSKATLVIAHEDFLDIAYTATRSVGIPAHRVVVLQNQDENHSQMHKFGESETVEVLIHKGIQSGEIVTEKKLAKMEGKTQVAFYASSSGTTGPPKIVEISHYAVIANVLLTVALNKVGRSSPKFVPGDRSLAVLPFYHVYGIVLLSHFNFYSGISVVVVPKFNFTDMLESINRHKINSLMVVPPQLVLLCKEPIVKNFDLSKIRIVLSAGSPLAGEILDQVIELLPQAYIGQAYGCTEATGVVTMTHVDMKHGRHGGILAPGIEGRVVKPDGTMVSYDEEGELCIRTPAAAIGYLDNEEATRETFLDAGWVRTGDLVKIDRNEEIIIVDRIKEMIKVRGFQVAPSELEGCILDHPLVSDVCVVGVPHQYSGEVPLAFITLTEEGLQTSSRDVKTSIHKHVANNKAPFKQLHRIEITDLIPRNPTGKLLRRGLREKGRTLMQSDVKL